MSKDINAIRQEIHAGMARQREEQRIARERTIAKVRAKSAIRDEDYQKLEIMLMEVYCMIEREGLSVRDFNVLNGIKNALTQAVGLI